MSHTPSTALPVTGGLVVAGHMFGLGWAAAAGIALVLIGFALVRWAPNPGRRASR